MFIVLDRLLKNCTALIPRLYLRHRVLLVAVVIQVIRAFPASRETLVTKETRVPWVLPVLRV